MRILYGVQGTGNGHITRARVMAGALPAGPSGGGLSVQRAVRLSAISTWSPSGITGSIQG